MWLSIAEICVVCCSPLLLRLFFSIAFFTSYSGCVFAGAGTENIVFDAYIFGFFGSDFVHGSFMPLSSDSLVSICRQGNFFHATFFGFFSVTFVHRNFFNASIFRFIGVKFAQGIFFLHATIFKSVGVLLPLFPVFLVLIVSRQVFPMLLSSDLLVLIMSKTFFSIPLFSERVALILCRTVFFMPLYLYCVVAGVFPLTQFFLMQLFPDFFDVNLVHGSFVHAVF